MDYILLDSKTAQNLASSYTIKASTSSCYMTYSKIAAEEGYQNISHLYQTFALNEKWHSWSLLRFLHENFNYETISSSTLLSIFTGTTEEILYQSALRERILHLRVLSEYEEVARQEGYPEVEKLFHAIRKIDQYHEKHLMSLYIRYRNHELFKNIDDVVWQCQNCAYYHIGTEAPYDCPVCHNPRSAFIITASDHNRNLFS